MSQFNAKIPPATVRRRSVVSDGDLARALKNLREASLGVTQFLEHHYRDLPVAPRSVADTFLAAINEANRLLALMGMLP